MEFEVIFKIFCMFGAVATAIWCCYEFAKNEDICEVSYKRFLQDSQSTYPDIFVLFPYLLNKTAFENLGGGINASMFKEILDGKRWDDRMLEIPLEDVSLKLENYMISSCIKSVVFEPCVPIEAITDGMFLGGLRTHSFQLPRDRPTTFATFQFRKSIFSNGIGPATQYDLMIAFQYPRRIYRSQGSLFHISWPLKEDDRYKNHAIDFKLRDMEVIQRRQKSGSECLIADDYDRIKLEDMILEVGCRPYYLNHSTVNRICKTKKEIDDLMTRNVETFFRLKQTEHDIPPCSDIQKLQIDHKIETTEMTLLEEHAKERFQDMGNDTWFEIRLEIQTDTFKEIKQKRAYSSQSLIGNLGGYLGIFIGFTLLDILKSMKKGSSKFKTYISSSLPSTKNMEIV